VTCFFRIDRSENIKIPFIIVAFGCPEQILHAVKIRGRVEHRDGIRPMLKVIADAAQDALPFRSAVVKVICVAIKKDIRVSAVEALGCQMAVGLFCGQIRDDRNGDIQIRNMHKGFLSWDYANVI
jgi:hypothetical protein